MFLIKTKDGKVVTTVENEKDIQSTFYELSIVYNNLSVEKKDEKVC